MPKKAEAPAQNEASQATGQSATSQAGAETTAASAQESQALPDIEIVDTKTHKKEKATLQESEDINQHTPKELKEKLRHNKGRAAQYEADLNRARDEI